MVIKEYQQRVAEAQAQVSAYKPEIERTQKMLRTTSNSTRSSAQLQQVKINELEKQRKLAKDKAQAQIDEAKAKLGQVLSTEEGKLQYAKEYNLPKKETITGRIVKGGVIEDLGYVYETPYGEVTDWTPKAEKIREQERYEATNLPTVNLPEGEVQLGYRTPEEYQEQLDWTRAWFGKDKGVMVTPSGIKLDLKLKEIQNIPVTDVRGEIIMPQELQGINAQSRLPIAPTTTGTGADAPINVSGTGTAYVEFNNSTFPGTITGL